MTRDYLKLSVNPIVHQVNVSYSHPFRYLDALQQVPQVRSDLSNYLKLSVNPIVHQVNVSYSHPFRYLDALQQVPQVRSDLSNHLISKQTIPEKNLLKVPYRKNNAFRRKSSVRLRSGMLITFLHIIHLQIWLNRNILQNFICFFFNKQKFIC
uniref:Uncharacterized protein n=1 Tax=Medicago truncatula TaxID=3880 RepID=I3SCB9_MEDTR|nr:unknown [Medicago truncatula]